MQVLTIQHVNMMQVKVHRIALLVSVMVEVQAAIVVLLELQLDHHHHHQVGPSLGNATHIRRDHAGIIQWFRYSTVYFYEVVYFVTVVFVGMEWIVPVCLSCLKVGPFLCFILLICSDTAVEHSLLQSIFCTDSLKVS